MAELRATPMVNPVMGLLADRLKKVQQFGAKPFGYENPPVEMLMNLLGVPAVQQTMERMAYGEPLTTGRGMTTKPRAEAVEAAMTLLPASAGLAKATKGLPVGASIKNVAKVDELTGLPLNADGTVTVYHHTNKKAADQITSSKKLKSAGEPDVYVTTEKEPNTGYGDTVVPIRINPEKLILDDEFPSGRMDFRIPSGKSGVPIKLEPKLSYPQQEALDTAQRNAIEYPLAPAGTRYEEFGGELTYMTPDEYLSRVRPLTLDEESLDNIAALKSHVQSGGQLDPLHIYQSGVEDGRHRAYMAKELGIEKIPVALHTEANNLGQNIPLDALSLLAEQKRKEITSLLDY